MIRPVELSAIKAGTIDLAFRRWDRPRVVVGTRMRTAAGLIEVTSVDVVDTHELTEEDARRAGYFMLPALLSALEQKADKPAYRVGLRYAGEDPRVALRSIVPDRDELATIQARLDRLDKAAKSGAWTRATLDLIDRKPEVRAPDLAKKVGRETAEFKTDVRKLKELGLTESLAIGYRLSPRGEAVVDAGRRRPRKRPPREEGTPIPHVGAPATRALRAAGSHHPREARAGDRGRGRGAARCRSLRDRPTQRSAHREGFVVRVRLSRRALLAAGATAVVSGCSDDLRTPTSRPEGATPRPSGRVERVDLDALDVTGQAKEPATKAELAAVAESLGPMPAGYAAIVTRFGFCAIGDFVRVYPPSVLEAITKDWRQRVTDYWFWDLTNVGLTKEEVQRGFSPADTFDGDEIVVVPGRADLLLLPRDADVGVRLDPDLRMAVAHVLDRTGYPPARSVETFSTEELRPPSP